MKDFRLTRILLTSLLLVLGVMGSGMDAALKVYRISGDVMVKTKTGIRKAERRETVLPVDELMIPDGGSVEILDSETHRIYVSAKTGNMTVKNLVEDAQEQASSVTKRTNKKVLDAIADNAAARRNSYSVGGISIHETDAVMHAPLVCPDSVSYLTYLMTLQQDNDGEDMFDIILMRRQSQEDEEAFNFSVFNTLAKPLFYNVIDIRDGNSSELYFPRNPIARPKKESIASEYRFLPDDEIKGYIVIASEKDFTKEDMEKLMQPGYDPDEEYFFSLLLTSEE